MTQELRKLANEWIERECDEGDIRFEGGSTSINKLMRAYIAAANPAAILSLLDRLEKAEKEPEITPAMVQAAEQVEDLYRRGTPDTWGKVFRAMWRAMEASK